MRLKRTDDRQISDHSFRWNAKKQLWCVPFIFVLSLQQIRTAFPNAETQHLSQQKPTFTMKKIGFLCLLLLPALLRAEERLPQTEKVQSIDLRILGLQYNYELPLSRLTTVGLHGGTGSDLSYHNGRSWYEEKRSNWSYTIRGVAGADFWYYYNLNRRARKGKRTLRNSGNFFSIDTYYVTPAIYSVNIKGTKHEIVVLPNYGIRRVYTSGWLIEARAGYGVGHSGYGWENGFKWDFKVEYSF